MPATNLSSITNSDNLVTDNVFLTALVKRLVQIKNEVFLPEFFTHGRNIQNMDVVNSNIDVVEFMDEKLSYQSIGIIISNRISGCLDGRQLAEEYMYLINRRYSQANMFEDQNENNISWKNQSYEVQDYVNIAYSNCPVLDHKQYSDQKKTYLKLPYIDKEICFLTYNVTMHVNGVCNNLPQFKLTFDLGILDDYINIYADKISQENLQIIKRLKDSIYNTFMFKPGPKYITIEQLLNILSYVEFGTECNEIKQLKDPKNDILSQEECDALLRGVTYDN